MVLPRSVDGDWRVYVLCAEWCGVCRDYKAFVTEQSQSSAQAGWRWIDVETHDDVLGELDVVNFPTLLIAQGDALRFLGPVMPQPEVALRLLASLQAGDRHALPEALDGGALVRALRML